MPAPRLQGLYAITPARESSSIALRQRVEAALRGGARLLQYRDKTTAPRRRHDEARDLLALCRRHHALFIVNDDVELAAAIGADGVHLGRDDATIAQARERLGAGAIVGASCYADLARGRSAAAQGADYLAFGSVFASATKPGAVRCPLELLGEARDQLGLPLCAIGGITRGNALLAVAAGADMLAVISDLFEAPDVETVAREYCRMLEAGPSAARAAPSELR